MNSPQSLSFSVALAVLAGVVGTTVAVARKVQRLEEELEQRWATYEKSKPTGQQAKQPVSQEIAINLPLGQPLDLVYVVKERHDTYGVAVWLT